MATKVLTDQSQVIVGGKTLKDFPKLLRQWHPTKNGPLKAHEVAAGSRKEVWWKCPKGPDHEWQSIISSRTRNRQGCPFCLNLRVSITNRLDVVAPHLVPQWDFYRNRPLLPNQVTFGSSQRVWWRCSRGPDHLWQCKVSGRVKGIGCPFCSNQRVSATNSLAMLNPDLARQWHPTKNGALTAGDVTPGSHKRVWWVCSEHSDHVWDAAVYSRASGRGCPFCAPSPRRVSETNSLATNAPHLAAQWHPTKNGAVRPTDVTFHSGYEAWWKCPKGRDHVWKARVATVTMSLSGKGFGCPHCAGKRQSVTNRVDIVAPHLVKEWDFEKNGDLTPDQFVVGSYQEVWWKCQNGPDHEWRTSIRNRTRGSQECPFCANSRVSLTNRFDVVAPHLVPQWDFERNRPLLPSQVTYASTRRVWWRCSKGPDHIWEYPIDERVKGYGCPFCSNHRASVTNALATHMPELAQQWHPTKNGDLTPADVTVRSAKRAWWKCPNGPDHEWEVTIAGRAAGSGCPYCSKPPKRVSVTNSLATTAPHLIAEWDSIKNGDLKPTDVLPGSTIEVWWKCPKGPDHEWQTAVYCRTGKSQIGCPFCAGHRVSVTNSLATRHPRIAAQWHPTKNGDLTPDKVTSGSRLRCYWQCVMGHEWETTIAGRTTKGRGCRYCKARQRRPVMTRARRETVYMPSYTGQRAGPVKRIR